MTSSLRVSKSGLELLPRDKVDPIYHEPFILKGYRCSEVSYSDCFRYAFVLHNDVGNFWTHLLPFVCWIIWLIILYLSWEDFFHPYHFPVLCFWVGACSYALCSSVAHLFSCKSFNVRTVCFLLDYLGISLYAFGAAIAALFYLNPVSSPCFSHKVLILTLEVLISTLATLFCGLTRFFWRNFRFLIRVLSFFLPWVCGIFPFAHRQWVCWQYGTDCVPETLFLHIAAIFITMVLVFFFVTKIPERFMPGKFDFIFQSHQLFHISAVILTTIQMYFLPIEMALRKTTLSQIEGTMPSWSTTFLPFISAGILGLVVVGVLGYLTSIGILTTNKYKLQ